MDSFSSDDIGKIKQLYLIHIIYQKQKNETNYKLKCKSKTTKLENNKKFSQIYGYLKMHQTI